MERLRRSVIQIDGGYVDRVAANIFRSKFDVVAGVGRKHVSGSEIETCRGGVPEFDLTKQVRSFDGGEHEVHSKRNGDTLRLQEASAGVGEITYYACGETKVAKLVGDHDIYLFRQIDVSRVSLDEDHPFRVPILPGHLAGNPNHPAHFNRVNATSPRAARQQSHDAGT